MNKLLLGLFLFVNANAQADGLLLFGGSGHDVFLGCLNCSRYDSGSVCNKYGDQGSKYSDKSIWNKYGNYGSRYSDSSPWNKYASNPPAIVDREGNFYGYFTANKYKDKRTKIKVLIVLTDNADWVTDDMDRARDALCEN